MKFLLFVTINSDNIPHFVSINNDYIPLDEYFVFKAEFINLY